MSIKFPCRVRHINPTGKTLIAVWDRYGRWGFPHLWHEDETGKRLSIPFVSFSGSARPRLLDLIENCGGVVLAEGKNE